MSKDTHTLAHTHTRSYFKDEFKEKGRKDEEHLCIGVSTCHHSNHFQVCKTEEGKKKSILDRRGSRSCEINYILFSNIIQRSLHSFRKVWSRQGAKNQLEMVMWKALQSSRQRPVLRSEMTLSSSLAGEGGWEGFKCSDSDNGHKGYLKWHWSPHWLPSSYEKINVCEIWRKPWKTLCPHLFIDLFIGFFKYKETKRLEEEAWFAQHHPGKGCRVWDWAQPAGFPTPNFLLLPLDICLQNTLPTRQNFDVSKTFISKKLINSCSVGDI